MFHVWSYPNPHFLNYPLLSDSSFRGYTDGRITDGDGRTNFYERKDGVCSGNGWTVYSCNGWISYSRDGRTVYDWNRWIVYSWVWWKNLLTTCSAKIRPSPWFAQGPEPPVFFFLSPTVHCYCLRMLAYEDTWSSPSVPIYPTMWPKTEEVMNCMARNKAILRVIHILTDVTSWRHGAITIDIMCIHRPLSIKKYDKHTRTVQRNEKF